MVYSRENLTSTSETVTGITGKEGVAQAHEEFWVIAATYGLRIRRCDHQSSTSEPEEQAAISLKCFYGVVPH